MEENNESTGLPKKVIIIDDKRKFDAIQMSHKGITGEDNEEQEKVFDKIKELQKEFQEKYCPSCGRYDLKKKDFKVKNHPNNPEDCQAHWTDILGECWNYYLRK